MQPAEAMAVANNVLQVYSHPDKCSVHCSKCWWLNYAFTM